jgi:broad specificity phosphatase PhoE
MKFSFVNDVCNGGGVWASIVPGRLHRANAPSQRLERAVGRVAVISHKAALTVLTRAAEKVGGLDALSQLLDVNVLTILRYMEGEEPTPETIYLRAVDIVLGEPHPKRP